MTPREMNSKTLNVVLLFQNYLVSQLAPVILIPPYTWSGSFSQWIHLHLLACIKLFLSLRVSQLSLDPRNPGLLNQSFMDLSLSL